MTDDFKGDNAQLVSCIESLIGLDADGALVPHGLGGHARGLLAAAASRLALSTNAGEAAEACLLSEANAEGFETVAEYVAALKTSKATYFAERNSARDAVRRNREETAAVHGQSASTDAPAGWLDLQDDPRVNEIVSGLYRRFKDWSQRGFSAEDVTWCEVKADVIRLIAASPPAAIPPPGDAMALGQAAARWTGGEYTAYRTDNGEPEQWLKVSVERLGFAIAALAAIPAAPMTDAEVERRTRLAFAATNETPYTGLCKHWYAKGLREGAALAQPAPVQQSAPYAWAVTALRTPFYGEFAEQDARSEARRVGGDAEAFPLYRAAPVQHNPELLLGWKRYEKLRKLSPAAFNRLHIVNTTGGGAFDDLVDKLPDPSTPVPEAAPVQQEAEAVTPAMISAGAAAAREYMERTGGNSPEAIYRAMRRAALQPTQGAKGGA